MRPNGSRSLVRFGGWKVQMPRPHPPTLVSRTTSNHCWVRFRRRYRYRSCPLRLSSSLCTDHPRRAMRPAPLRVLRLVMHQVRHHGPCIRCVLRRPHVRAPNGQDPLLQQHARVLLRRRGRARAHRRVVPRRPVHPWLVPLLLHPVLRPRVHGAVRPPAQYYGQVQDREVGRSQGSDQNPAG